MMTITTIGYLSVALYLLTWLFIALKLGKQQAGEETFPNKYVVVVAWAAALVTHAISLYMPLITDKAIYLDFFSAASHIMLLTSFILFITTCTRRIEALGLFVLPMTLFFVLVSLIAPPIVHKAIHISGKLGVHIMLSMLGYSMLALAALQAILLAIQNRNLHKHRPGGITDTLPSLQDMEHLLFRLTLLGVILLTMSLLTGFLFLDNPFAKEHIHKTVLSMIAWIVYSVLLIGHWREGWRGRKAIHWTLAAFVFLILGFLGTKFVREFLIG